MGCRSALTAIAVRRNCLLGSTLSSRRCMGDDPKHSPELATASATTDLGGDVQLVHQCWPFFHESGPSEGFPTGARECRGKGPYRELTEGESNS